MIRPAAVFLLAAVAFGAGLGGALIGGKLGWFRSDRFLGRPAQSEAPAGPAALEAPAVSTIGTNLLRLTATVHASDNALGLRGYGGGLAAIGDGALGVDRRGQFFYCRSGGPIRKIELGLDFNLADYDAYLGRKDYSPWWRDRHSWNVAVVGLAARVVGAGAELYVCHDHWIPETASKTMRISRLAVDDWEALLTGRFEPDSASWNRVSELGPAIPYADGVMTPFTTNHRGGRMVFDAAGDLIVAIGDHRMDGVSLPLQASQDPASWFGKILRIKPASGDVSIFAYGVRNPQGLLLDRDGALWETEHGPKGGDELNLLVEGENYGWPLATLGVDDNANHWPLSERQGRHDGFAAPVYAWLPSIGVSNLIQARGKPERWDGDLLISSLIGQSLFRARLEAGRVAYAERIEIGERIRDLVQLENGAILLWTDSGRLVELSETPPNEALFAEPLTEAERAAGLAEVLGRCVACHGLAPDHWELAAPNLWGVHGRRIGGVRFSGYSPALRAAVGHWDDASLRAYLRDPQSYLPGTSMPSPALDAAALDQLIAYLRRLR